jgi:hypothetical protein
MVWLQLVLNGAIEMDLLSAKSKQPKAHPAGRSERLAVNTSLVNPPETRQCLSLKIEIRPQPSSQLNEDVMQVNQAKDRGWVTHNNETAPPAMSAAGMAYRDLVGGDLEKENVWIHKVALTLLNLNFLKQDNNTATSNASEAGHPTHSNRITDSANF